MRLQLNPSLQSLPHAGGRHAGLVCLAMALAWSTASAGDVNNRVVFEHGPLTVDHSKTIPQITQAQATKGFRAVHGAELGLGLYQSRMDTSLQATLSPGGKLTMETRIKTEPVIYIAKEFPEDSCAYKVVLNHERQHYLYDRDVLRALPGEVQSITWAVFANPIPTTEGELERAKKLFFQQYNYAYESLSFPLHSRIDNAASYAELAEQCQGEIKKRLASKP